MAACGSCGLRNRFLSAKIVFLAKEIYQLCKFLAISANRCYMLVFFRRRILYFIQLFLKFYTKWLMNKTRTIWQNSLCANHSQKIGNAKFSTEWLPSKKIHTIHWNFFSANQISKNWKRKIFHRLITKQKNSPNSVKFF